MTFEVKQFDPFPGCPRCSGEFVPVGYSPFTMRCKCGWTLHASDLWEARTRAQLVERLYNNRANGCMREPLL